MKTFKDKVLDVVSQIPKGGTLTYGEVAGLSGSPGAARAVGTIMSSNYDPNIPCHRVVASNGIGGYNGGVETKKRLLDKEYAETH